MDTCATRTYARKGISDGEGIEERDEARGQEGRSEEGRPQEVIRQSAQKEFHHGKGKRRLRQNPSSPLPQGRHQASSPQGRRRQAHLERVHVNGDGSSSPIAAAGAAGSSSTPSGRRSGSWSWSWCSGGREREQSNRRRVSATGNAASNAGPEIPGGYGHNRPDASDVAESYGERDWKSRAHTRPAGTARRTVSGRQ